MGRGQRSRSEGLAGVKGQRGNLFCSTFAHHQVAHVGGLCGAYSRVVGAVAEHVRVAVDQSRDVEHVHVAEEDAAEDGKEEGLIPEDDGNGRWDDAPEEDQQGHVVLLLEHDDGIRLNVRHVQLVALFQYQGVLFEVDPALGGF